MLYEITVLWDKQLFVHHSWTRKDALDWMACYPAECHAKLWSWFGKLLASRN